jgi:uncharacterized coiled-coil protein SlyX
MAPDSDDPGAGPRHAAEVVGQQTVIQHVAPDHEPRLRELEQTTAAHSEVIKHLREATAELTSSIRDIGARLDKLVRYLLVLGVLILAGTKNGDKTLQLIGHLLGM